MEFAPLAYLWGTLTVWHVAIWIAFLLLMGVVLQLRADKPVLWKVLPLYLIILAIAYGIFALIFGQIFGDKYSWSQLWPSGALLGGSFGALIFADRSATRPPAAFALVGVAFAAVFFTFCIWLFPRVIGFGLIDFPKAAWGVQL
ncbi:MAG: hypothetical protein GC147_02965 [Porphyrobacter sp.]|nr:hypothetical protein [Porphyrobacter sp.]